MPMELITGVAGSAHVDSADIGAMLAALVGSGSYIMDGGTCTMTNANTAHIAKGEFLLEGRHVRITGAGMDATIDNGEIGKKRNDLVCMRYRLIQGIESVAIAVLKGTSTTGTPADPTVPDASILDGDADVYIPLYRVPLDGITPQTPVLVISGKHNTIPLSDLPIELLWTNESPGSSFIAQTVSLDLSGYGMVLIRFHPSAAYDHTSTAIGKTGEDVLVDAVVDKHIVRRYASTTASSISFTSGTLVSSYGSATSEDNGYCVPIGIYGIKGVN